jgi:hypothetical protein
VTIDLSAPTEELDAVGKPSTTAARRPVAARSATEAPLAGVHGGPAGQPTAPAGLARSQCAACGAALASDQRYCVECGQRLGAARLPFMDDPGRYAATAQYSAPPRRSGRMSVNSTLIAGVGTLLLAMGIGILIGRASPGSSTRSTPVQVVGLSGTGTAGASAAPEAQSSSTGASAAGGSSAKGGKAQAKAAKAKLPPPKVVTVGSPGKGPGYEKGHFTGNFFGKGEE